MSSQVPRFFGSETTPIRTFVSGTHNPTDIDVKLATRIVQHGGILYPPTTITPITKIIHFIWVNDDASKSNFNSHPQFDQNIAAFKQANPSWEVKIWDEERVSNTHFPVNNFANRSLFDSYHCEFDAGRKSDILRYELLYNFGGVYVDVDYMCLRPFPADMLETGFFCGASNTGCVELNNGLIGSCAGHPILGRLIASIAEYFSTSSAAAAAAPAQSAPQPPLGLLASYLSGAELTTAAIAFDTSRSAVEGDNEENYNKRQQRLTMAQINETIAQTGPGLLTRIVMGCFDDDQLELNGGGAGLRVYKYGVFHSVPNTARGGGVPNGECFVTDVSVAVSQWACCWEKKA